MKILSIRATVCEIKIIRSIGNEYIIIVSMDARTDSKIYINVLRCMIIGTISVEKSI